MSVIDALRNNNVYRGSSSLREEIGEQCDEVIQTFAARVKHYAAQHKLRSVELGVFVADILYVVRGTGVIYFVFVMSEIPEGGEIRYEDWLFDEVPSLDYVASAVTFDFVADIAFSFTLSDDEVNGVEQREALDKLAKSYVESVLHARETAAKRKLERKKEAHSVELSNDVFIVHGHDNEMKQYVARVLTQLGLVPNILHEKPNQGRTIIEKLEANTSDVGFAVVLLSPDDMAYIRSQTPEQARPRARQNVVLELGYFIAKLGREKVMPLYKGAEAFELPSDIAGVVYTPFDDAGHWRYALADELKAAGYTIDKNKL
jgi:predicted nucleotide-binding protein